ncbi:hypothetical protein [Glycomyces buryatensis]|uniref:Uncharacterized protein n=1 Tax=Glycomyces buryatensis TaxID=2570927 RepID=A0A4S8PR39_9ACTN|nr:hypothetical protein [Glycomyces buryatensis]THV33647.1 hypothetical protein FAB82_26295 [Glycomyces buryatensis]
MSEAEVSGLLRWRRAGLVVLMIAVALGVAWMHGAVHIHDGPACHTTVAESPIQATGESALAADPGPESASHLVQTCAAMLTMFCLAVLTAAMWHRGRGAPLRAPGPIRRPAFRWTSSRPPGGRLSFMEISVLRI